MFYFSFILPCAMRFSLLELRKQLKHKQYESSPRLIDWACFNVPSNTV